MNILVIGSADWTDNVVVYDALFDLVKSFDGPLYLVHGNNEGADQVAEMVWLSLIDWNPHLDPLVARFDEDLFAGCPEARDEHLLTLDIDLCLVFSVDEDSDTSRFSKRIRDKGVPTVDYGATTCVESS